MLLQAGRRAQHLRQGEPRAEQEQQEAQRPARRGRRLGAELQLDVLERRAAVAAGAAWRLRGGVLSLSLPAWTKTRMSHAATSCVCTGTVHGAGLIGRTAAPCGVECGVVGVASRVAVWSRWSQTVHLCISISASSRSTCSLLSSSSSLLSLLGSSPRTYPTYIVHVSYTHLKLPTNRGDY